VKVEVVQLFPLPWSPELELEERRVVPDRTGQVWVINDFGPHLILEPAIHVVGPAITTDARWVHPALSLITGEQRRLGEWIDEPWLTRDSGSRRRIA
jgi:hypothetical protein